MNTPFFIAKRLTANSQSSFSRLIIRLAMLSVALSLAVMIIASSMIQGFKKEISAKMFGLWGHIHVTDINVSMNNEPIPISDNQPFLNNILEIDKVPYLNKGIFPNSDNERTEPSYTKGAFRHVQKFALLKGIISSKNEFEGIVCKGIGSDFDFLQFKKYLVEGVIFDPENYDPKNRPIVLSKTTANRLDVSVNDYFTITFFNEGRQVRRRYQVTGIYKTGLIEYDKKLAFIPIAEAQKVLGWDANQVHGFEIFVDHLDELDILNEYLYYEKLPQNVFAQTIKKKHPMIFEWLELQNINEYVIMILLIIVCIINMITALLILIIERTNMIGILKSFGFPNKSLQRIFLYFASFILIYGVLFGNLLGIGLCFLQETTGFIKLDEENYYLDTAPVYLDFWRILSINILVVVVVILSLFVPAYWVNKISPVKAIRVD